MFPCMCMFVRYVFIFFFFPFKSTHFCQQENIASERTRETTTKITLNRQLIWGLAAASVRSRLSLSLSISGIFFFCFNCLLLFSSYYYLFWKTARAKACACVCVCVKYKRAAGVRDSGSTEEFVFVRCTFLFCRFISLLLFFMIMDSYIKATTTTTEQNIYVSSKT